MFFPQRRKGAKKTFRNAAALCAFAPLREKSFLVPLCVVIFLCCSVQELNAQTAQQTPDRHSYKIDLKIDFEHLTYTGTERVSWINRGEKPHRLSLKWLREAVGALVVTNSVGVGVAPLGDGNHAADCAAGSRQLNRA